MQMHVATAPTVLTPQPYAKSTPAHWISAALAIMCVTALYGVARLFQDAVGTQRHGQLAEILLGYSLALFPLIAIAAMCLRSRSRVSVLDVLAVCRPVDPDSTVWRVVGLSSVVIVGVVVATSILLHGVAGVSGNGLARFAGALAGGSVALALLLVVVAPVCEELVFRGYLHGRIARSVGGIAAPVIVTAVVFMAMHLPTTPHYAATLIGMGFVLGVLRMRCGSALPGIVLHGVWNAMVCALGAIASIS